MDQLSPKAEPSLEDNPFELSESDEEEDELKIDHTIDDGEYILGKCW